MTQRQQYAIPLTEEMIDAARPLFLGLECGVKTVEGMRDQLRGALPRIDPATLPDWFRKETGHLTKAGRAIVAWHLMIAAAPPPPEQVLSPEQRKEFARQMIFIGDASRDEQMGLVEEIERAVLHNLGAKNV